MIKTVSAVVSSLIETSILAYVALFRPRLPTGWLVSESLLFGDAETSSDWLLTQGKIATRIASVFPKRKDFVRLRCKLTVDSENLRFSNEKERMNYR